MKTIQEMAREAQLPYFYQTGEIANLKQLEAFAAMVREDERDRIAKLCDDLDDDWPGGLASWQYGEAIRARSNT